VKLEDRKYGNVTVHFGDRGGKYPHGNTLVVHGGEERLVIDPSLGIVARDMRPEADRLVNSHCHEDHVAGNYLYADIPWHLHEADIHGMQSLDAMREIYGYPEPAHSAFTRAVVEQFHYVPNPEALSFRDGDVFDLGGGVRLRVIHTPGHTRGHCAFLIEPEGVLYLGDIELTSFGPYYGDAWSDLESFERSLRLIRDIEAGWYATFHHIGVLDRAGFEERIDRFGKKIMQREAALIEFLAEPHSMEEIVAHRFVYRPADDLLFADPVERRSMSQHLERLLEEGRVLEDSPGRYRARPAA